MFHLLFGLIGLGFFVVIGAIILFFLTLFIVSIFGGASAALIVKDKIIKRLLFMGFSMMFLTASTPFVPFVGMYTDMPLNFYPIIYIVIFVLVGILAIVGLKTANSIDRKIGRIIAIIAYSILCILAIPIVIFVGAFILMNMPN